MGHRLLVVDSDRRFLQEHKATMESAFDVDFREGTEGSLAHLESGSYAAVLLCVEASENKGYSLCSAIRRSPFLADLKVALISAKATEEEYHRHQSLKGRADLYLHKPIRPSALVSVLTPLVPQRVEDPDNPLGDLGGADLGDEWLDSLRSELEMDILAEPEPAPAPAPVSAPVSVLLGLARPLPPVPAVPRDTGRVELLEARVHDLETKLVALADEAETRERELAECRLRADSTKGLLEEKTWLGLDLETRLATAETARSQGAQAMEELQQRHQATLALLAEKTQQHMDMLEANQLLQAQLAESREELEQQAQAGREAQEHQLRMDLEAEERRAQAELEELDQRAQLEREHQTQQEQAARELQELQVRLARTEQEHRERLGELEQAHQAHLDETEQAHQARLDETGQAHQAQLDRMAQERAGAEADLQRQQLDLLDAIQARDQRLAGLEADLAAQSGRIEGLEREQAAAGERLLVRTRRLEQLQDQLANLEQQTRQVLDLARSEMPAR
jgi:CheY-like chemotaxis protein